MAKITRCRFNPQAIHITFALQHASQLCGVDHLWCVPFAVVHLPQMFSTTLGAAAIGEANAKNLFFALREHSCDDGWLPINRGYGIAYCQVPHGCPPRTGTHARIQRLGFAHTRSCCQNHQIPCLKTGCHTVKIVKPSWHASDFIGVFGHLGDAVKQTDDQSIHALKTFFHARTLFANLEDHFFCFVQNAGDVFALRVKRIGGDFIAGGDQLAQNGTLAHDFCIAPDIGSTGHVLCK